MSDRRKPACTITPDPVPQRRGVPEISAQTGLWRAYRLRSLRQKLLLRAWHKGRELRALANRTDQIKASDILCAIVLRNEHSRLPYFLAHHRQLGVNHFLVIDNGSTDGSADYLRDQADVSLWATEANYKKSRFGLDWLNALLRRYGSGHWCLVLDADELLLYPYHETRPLPALTAWLEAQGQDMLPAMMLDLYPQGALSAGQYQPGDDPRALLSHFDAGNFSIQIQPRLGNLWIQGGVRARAFFADTPRRAPTLNKVPLVKWHWRYAWLNSTHSLLPARLNHFYQGDGGEGISGVLLHTKFLPEIIDKSDEEKQRLMHFAEPAAYTPYYDSIIANPTLHLPQSHRLGGWRQLEALGLMSRGGWI